MTTTSQDLIPALNARLEEIGVGGDDGIQVAPTSDFTVLEVYDSQEKAFISIETAINWMERLNDPACLGFDDAWQALINLPNWETTDPDKE